MRSAQSLQEIFVESAESCERCHFSFENLFTNQKLCDIMKMLWCPNFRASFFIAKFSDIHCVSGRRMV